MARSLARAAPTGESIKFVRKALGLSGEALGALLGVRFETVSRWERGLHPIDRPTWALLGLMVADRALRRRYGRPARRWSCRARWRCGWPEPG